MEPLQPEFCCIRRAYTDLVLMSWFCFYRGGLFLVTEQKLVMLVHHLTVVIPHPALLFYGVWAALQGGFCLSQCQIPLLIHCSVWHEDLGNVLTWRPPS